MGQIEALMISLSKSLKKVKLKAVLAGMNHLKAEGEIIEKKREFGVLGVRLRSYCSMPKSVMAFAGRVTYSENIFDSSCLLK
jgi:hypothetical protein